MLKAHKGWFWCIRFRQRLWPVRPLLRKGGAGLAGVSVAEETEAGILAGEVCGRVAQIYLSLGIGGLMVQSDPIPSLLQRTCASAPVLSPPATVGIPSSDPLGAHDPLSHVARLLRMR